MRPSAPEQFSALAVEGHLEDAVLPFHPDELETVLVIVEMAHAMYPAGFSPLP